MLRERHIFQWETHYRDELAPLFADFVLAEQQGLGNARISNVAQVKSAFAEHTYSVATQGFHFTMRAAGPESTALNKSLSGFQRFLELPVEFYSAGLTNARTSQHAIALRRVCSAILSGILEGYGSCKLGSNDGWNLLTRARRVWCHYVGFLTAEDCKALAEALPEGSFAQSIRRIAIPILGAIDKLVQTRTLNCSSLPAIGQYEPNSGLWSIAVEGAQTASGRLLELHGFLDDSKVSLGSIEEAIARGIAVVVAKVRPDLAEAIEAREILRQHVVLLRDDADTNATADRIVEVLRLEFATQLGTIGADAPLNYNFPRDFPLHNAFLSKYFHVVRPTVRELLGRFDRRNGVRIWCSVRRSGKTTACFDLGTSTGRSTVVSQTCDRTVQNEDSDLFYRIVSDALSDRGQLPPSFFKNMVELCSPERRSTEIRFVFVLDEYETLFERLRLAATRDPELRYTVVQPLLNQMVEFTRDNLLVLIGQRPDAHFIFMDQNQLSAYVEQDAFPLFRHAGFHSEFSELVRKVVSERVPFEEGFVSELYSETSGHPFLTVKVLSSFFDWLIESSRSMRGLLLTGDDFKRFAAERLSARYISTDDNYQFFQNATANAISEMSRRDTPWLYAVYSILRRLGQDSPISFSCSEGEFENLVNELGLSDLGFSAPQLQLTGSQANFLHRGGSTVAAKIPLLARIASSTRPRIYA